MRILPRLASTATTFAWALWFGGLVGLFVCVRATFGHSRDLGTWANPIIFNRFEQYQLFLTAFAVASAVSWRMLVRSERVTAVAGLFVLGAVLFAYSTFGVTRPMQRLTDAGQTKTAEWRSLHGRSMMLYAAQAAVMLAAGLVLPSALARENETSAARTRASRESD